MAPVNSIVNLYLSKSQFVRGLQCHKALYLHKYRPDLKDEASVDQETKFQSGTDVGKYAQELFPGGVEIVFDDSSLVDQLKQTQQEIENGAGVIYEAAFSYNDIFVKVDILRKWRGKWEIYEVKNSSSVKEHHYNDVAVQYYVLKGCGLPISKAFIVHINNQYVKNGDINVQELFTKENITQDVIQSQDFVLEEVGKMREMLKGEEPDVDIGSHCSNPYDCDFWGHCWQHIPENSVFSLKGRGPDKFDLYRQGIIRLEDVPKEILPRDQRIQLEGALEKKNVTDKKAIQEFLDTLWYPICFLDFETTFMVPIPLFDGTRPYQEVPFQYSLHYQKNEHAEIMHYEYLGASQKDPRKDLIDNLLNNIPADACVLTYNQTFEIGVLSDLSNWFPEHASRIENIIGNIRDLMGPFRRKDIYRWEMQGSYSLKYVLPALLSNLNYDEMEINNGQMAAESWLNTWAMEDPKDIQIIRNALLEYCKMDTLAMVKIVEKLREFCIVEDC